MSCRIQMALVMRTPDSRRQRIFGSQITLLKLEVFCAVAELSNVTRAAECLGIAQPAVTGHLRDLEDKLNAKLVARSGRNIILTEAGERVHRWAAEILTGSLEMRREVTGLTDGTAGHAVIAGSMCVGTYVLTDLVVAFRSRFPNSHITTKIFSTPDAIDAVRSGACDFGVLMLDPRQELDDLVVQGLPADRLLLVAAPDYMPAKTRLGLSSLSTLSFVCTPKGWVRRELEDELLHLGGVIHREVTVELGHPEAIKRAVAKGMGVAFVEESAARADLERGALRRITTPGLNLSLPQFLVYRRGKLLSEMQRRLIEFIQTSLAAWAGQKTKGSADGRRLERAISRRLI
jgi:DNA-binding transcriptional LysR family regulator